MKTRTCGNCLTVHPVPTRKAPVPAQDPWLCKKCSHRRWVESNDRPTNSPPRARPKAGCSPAIAQKIAHLLTADPEAWDRFRYGEGA